MRRILILMWKEFLELRQDPRIFPIVFIAPVVQLTVLGYAATTDVKNVPIIVLDADRSSASRELIERFEASPYFTVIDVVSGVNEIDRHLEGGQAWMALSIPTDYGERIGRGIPVVVQAVADGSDANSVNIGLGYAANLVAAYAQELLAARTPGGAAPGAIDMRLRVWYNPQLESRDFMVPGVLAMILLLMTAILGSMAIVREKELGTLEQLNVTPLSRGELIVGKLLPYGAIGFIQIFLVVAVVVFWFQVPLRGSLLLLLAMSVIYIFNALGIGLFVSTVSETQQQAMMTAVFFFLVPMVYLSGFVFPIENMPALIQPITYLIPLRYYLVIIRGIFLKGIGLETLWPQAFALLVSGLAILALAVARSSKRAG